MAPFSFSALESLTWPVPLNFQPAFQASLSALTFFGVLGRLRHDPGRRGPGALGFGLGRRLVGPGSIRSSFFPLDAKIPRIGPHTFGFFFGPFFEVFLGVLWVSFLSAWNSSESFESFSAFKGFLVLGFWWFALRHLWKKFPELFPLFEKLFRFSALVVAAWVLAGVLLGRLEPFAGPFPNANFTAIFLGMALILWGIEWLHGNSNRSRLFSCFSFSPLGAVPAAEGLFWRWRSPSSFIFLPTIRKLRLGCAVLSPGNGFFSPSWPFSCWSVPLP